ncbi:Heterokaryon incompatibility protein HET [Pyrenophora tritici-repentis]|nr:Heterokaryon incompatibility protein [Pyrenophora tritici-repentis]KAF7569048.1 HET domain containing protein [Pyrenophora tritici-repentis]KAI0576427.1 Heterokaryon incompatibility protein HET [Pyrenophora tritici-repentis]KAI1508489.1 Heterokaryon incompatibility protein HET [Pyrenophora tritici-repentis]KAI1541741.1 Heterokaryon incompatibility protein HET [Pyrenophora tritici-repentis]
MDLTTTLPEEKAARPWTYIDWPWLRSYLSPLMEPQKREDTTHILPVYEPLRDIRVIDVDQRCVIQLPQGAQYVALSYVLSFPGNLENIDLALTILDAMTACRELEHRYLWIDRLCIVQDEIDANSIELKHMGSLYHHAAFTIVAAAGSSAACGLSGISRARQKREYLDLQNGLKIVEPAPDLPRVFSKSKWNQRGWTYQEHIPSSVLVFFTDYGLYIEHKTPLQEYISAEAPGSKWRIESGVIEYFLAHIQEYMERTLKNQADVLQTFSGLLESRYGHRTSFGLPWDIFNLAILWVQNESCPKPPITIGTDVFPTWSWISARSVKFLQYNWDICSLAYWCTTVQSDGTSTRVAIGGSHASCPNLLVGLAWANGCIRSTLPEYFKLDCSREDYSARLQERSSDNSLDYRQEAFQEYDEKELFKDIPEELTEVPGRIMVHTQKASFTLDCTPYGSHEHPILIRSNGRFAGVVHADQNARELINTINLGQSRVDCIALSMSQEHTSYISLSDIYFTELPSISEFYGCPCSPKQEADITTSTDHVAEFPKHADFRETVSVYHPGATVARTDLYHWDVSENNISKLYIKNGDCGIALSKHLSGQSYLDIHGNLLRVFEMPPCLHVMFIIPSPVQGNVGTVYQRLCLGTVYLKQWVEASPKSESIVLE